jgi:hypothetical protein
MSRATQYPERPVNWIEMSRNTGYSAFAEYDDLYREALAACNNGSALPLPALAGSRRAQLALGGGVRGDRSNSVSVARMSNAISGLNRDNPYACCRRPVLMVVAMVHYARRLIYSNNRFVWHIQ